MAAMGWGRDHPFSVESIMWPMLQRYDMYSGNHIDESAVQKKREATVTRFLISRTLCDLLPRDVDGCYLVTGTGIPYFDQRKVRVFASKYPFVEGDLDGQDLSP